MLGLEDICQIMNFDFRLWYVPDGMEARINDVFVLQGEERIPAIGAGATKEEAMEALYDLLEGKKLVTFRKGEYHTIPEKVFEGVWDERAKLRNASTQTGEHRPDPSVTTIDIDSEQNITISGTGIQNVGSITTPGDVNIIGRKSGDAEPTGGQRISIGSSRVEGKLSIVNTTTGDNTGGIIQRNEFTGLKVNGPLHISNSSSGSSIRIEGGIEPSIPGGQGYIRQSVSIGGIDQDTRLIVIGENSTIHIGEERDMDPIEAKERAEAERNREQERAERERERAEREQQREQEHAQREQERAERERERAEREQQREREQAQREQERVERERERAEREQQRERERAQREQERVERERERAEREQQRERERAQREQERTARNEEARARCDRFAASIDGAEQNNMVYISTNGVEAVIDTTGAESIDIVGNKVTIRR